MLGQRLLSSFNALRISPEVRQALSDKTPLVALESTIITHGFPYPANLSMAQEVEQTIRENGCVPATCAFIGGTPYVGLSNVQVQQLAELKDANKVSRRDIGVTMAQKLNGGTTIAGTMILSHLAGIKVFATGGLGGVHRDGHITMDISADLTELSRTPMTVVCAGPKSILDIPRTMEFLETQGVFVGTYNDNGRPYVQVPGFFCRDSGVQSPYTFSSWREMASIVHNQNNVMGLSSGNLVCVPPPEHSSLSSEFMAQIIHEATSEASEKGVMGKHLTPFLLQKIAKATDGKSVECNKQFVINNAKAACNIAKELYSIEKTWNKEQIVPEKKGDFIIEKEVKLSKKIGKKESLVAEEAEVSENEDIKNGSSGFQPSTGLKKSGQQSEKPSKNQENSPKRAETLIIGSVALDTICRFERTPIMGDSNPGSISSTIGGVGFNVSLAHKYGLVNQNIHSSVRFVSVVGDDISGTKVMDQIKSMDLDVSGIKVVENATTAQYCASLNDQGGLVLACADMKIMEKPELLHHSLVQIQRAKPRFIILDCNISAKHIEKVLFTVSQMDIKPRVIIEPTSIPKSTRLSHVHSSLLSVFPHNNVSMITPTCEELQQMYTEFSRLEMFEDYEHWFPILDGLGINGDFRDKMASAKNPCIQSLVHQGTLQQAFQMLPYIPNILIKLGEKGCVLVKLSTSVDDYRSIPTTSEYRPSTLISQGKLLQNKSGGGRLGVVVEYYDVPTENKNLSIVNVTGAGDSLLGYVSSALTNHDWLGDEVQSLEHEWGRWKAIHTAQLASGASLVSSHSISPKIMHLKG